MPPAAAIDNIVRPLLRLALGLLHLLALVLALVPAFSLSLRSRPRSSTSSSSAAGKSDKPPPKHVQLLIVAPSSTGSSAVREAAVGQLVVESIARAVAWATAEGVTELSVFEPSDLLPKLQSELIFRLTARPPTPPSSTPSSPPFPVDRRPLRETASSSPVDTERSHLPPWVDGYVTIECGRWTGEDDEDNAMHTPASVPAGRSVMEEPNASRSSLTTETVRHRAPHPSTNATGNTTATKRPTRRPLQVHLLTTQSGQPLLTQIARSFATEPIRSEVDVASVTAAVGRRLPFAHLDPDLLLIHRLEPYDTGDLESAHSSRYLSTGLLPDCSDRTLAPADPGSRPAYWSPTRLARRWALSLVRAAAVCASDRPVSTWLGGGAESVRLFGIGVWGLRVTEIYQTSARTASSSASAASQPSTKARNGLGRALDREDWTRAMDAWRGIEQRYGR